jgi:hypothetical protein
MDLQADKMQEADCINLDEAPIQARDLQGSVLKKPDGDITSATMLFMGRTAPAGICHVHILSYFSFGQVLSAHDLCCVYKAQKSM